jgi:hypothetical protein
MKELRLLSIVAITAFIFPSLPQTSTGVILVQNGQYSGQYSGRYSGQYAGQWSGQYSGRYSGQYTGQSASRGISTSSGEQAAPTDEPLPVNPGSCGELHSTPEGVSTDSQGRLCQ